MTYTNFYIVFNWGGNTKPHILLQLPGHIANYLEPSKNT